MIIRDDKSMNEIMKHFKHLEFLRRQNRLQLAAASFYALRRSVIDEYCDMLTAEERHATYWERFTE